MDASSVDAAVAQLPLLANLDTNAKPQIAAMIRSVSDLLRYEPDELLIEEGYLSFGTGYVVVKGTVTVELEPNPVELNAPALLGEMAQFKAVDMRNANVRAKTEAVALRFYWDDVYAAAEKSLSPQVMAAFRDALELQVWDRFPHKDLIALPLFGGLTEDLKRRVCTPFPSISERTSLQRVETLFNQGGKCKMTGFLLVGGKLRLMRDKNETVLTPPNILGIFPSKADLGKEWTGTAMAEGEAQLLKFSWERYTNELTRRLSRDEQTALIGAFRNNTSKHFRH